MIEASLTKLITVHRLISWLLIVPGVVTRQNTFVGNSESVYVINYPQFHFIYYCSHYDSFTDPYLSFPRNIIAPEYPIC